MAAWSPARDFALVYTTKRAAAPVLGSVAAALKVPGLLKFGDVRARYGAV